VGPGRVVPPGCPSVCGSSGRRPPREGGGHAGRWNVGGPARRAAEGRPTRSVSRPGCRVGSSGRKGRQRSGYRVGSPGAPARARARQRPEGARAGRSLGDGVVGRFLAKPMQDGICGMRVSGPSARRLASPSAHWSVGMREEGGRRAQAQARGPTGGARALFWRWGRESFFRRTHTKWVLRDPACGSSARRLVSPTAPRSVGMRERGRANEAKRPLTCSPAGGMSGSPWAPLRGSLRGQAVVPVHTSPQSRGDQRVTVPPSGRRRAPPQPRRRPQRTARRGAGAASGKTPKAQGNTPCAPGVGLCGCLAAGQTYFKATGGTYRLGKP
jgi:hypothetical protein